MSEDVGHESTIVLELNPRLAFYLLQNAEVNIKNAVTLLDQIAKGKAPSYVKGFGSTVNVAAMVAEFKGLRNMIVEATKDRLDEFPEVATWLAGRD